MDLPKDSSEREINIKYRNLARRVHQDKHPNKEKAAEQFQRLEVAHYILGDKKKREVYDKYRSAGIWMCEKYGYKMAQGWYKGLLWTAALCLCCCLGCLCGCCLCGCCC